MTNGKAVKKPPTLSMLDAVALTVGIVIGASVFETPGLVAANMGSGAGIVLAWVLGGVISLIGALCLAELATAYPHPGGGYHYLHRAFGLKVAFLFAWARLAVIQTGSIALLAFVFGDYASQIHRFGEASPSLYAAGIIVLLTTLNVRGVQPGRRTQNLPTVAQLLGLLLVIVVGLTLAPPAAPGAPAEGSTAAGSYGLAMVFVLLTYGGWSEAVYVSAELRDVRRSMPRALLLSIGLITAFYLLINWAYLRGLGPAAMSESDAVAVGLMRRAVGEPGALFLSALVAVATLCSANATIITGARSNYALGRDFTIFSFFGQWRDRTGTPANGLLVQGGWAIALVLLGTFTRGGFEAMVAYTAPVFWLSLLLIGASVMVLRVREPHVQRPFRVPLYPLVPILFCAACAYMFYASLAYAGAGALVGMAVLLAGAPLLFWEWRRERIRTAGAEE